MTGTNEGAGTSLVRRDDGAGGSELEVRGDLNALTIGAREEATVKARVALARAQPRDWETVRAKLLRECQRKGFADAAMYKVPKAGSFIEGLSIRFAETAGRLSGNLWVQAQVIHESATSRTIEVWVMDLETNFVESQQAVIARTVEKKADRNGNPPANATVLHERRNSFGEKIFVCYATDAEMLERTNSVTSRLRRTKLLEMVPADIRDDCIVAIRKTAADAAKADPDATRKALLDAFSLMNILPAEVKSYVLARFSTPLERLRPEHLAEMRLVHQAVKEGTPWEQFMSSVAEEEGKAVDKKTGEVVTAPALPARITVPAISEAQAEKLVEIASKAQTPAVVVRTDESATRLPELVREPVSTVVAANDAKPGELVLEKKEEPKPTEAPLIDEAQLVAKLLADIAAAAEAPDRDAQLKGLARRVAAAPKERANEVSKAFIAARLGKKS